ncbi:MAG: oligosaccharide flippase family protein [Thaumarchaeota archaeon]|nr:oligosaccharide flippase family protein [Nitrososphaerota archaeon]
MSSISVAQASARGTLILFVGNLLSTGIVTVATIFVARLLGPDGYGLYTLAFLVPTILQLFVGFGVSSAVTRYVAYFLSTGDVARAASMTRTAVIFSLLFGLALSAVNFVVAPYFVVAFMHRPELVQYEQVSSLFILGVAISQCSTSALLGWGSMVQVGLFTVFQSVLKIVFGVGLILAGFGVYGAVIGHVASYMVQGCVVSLAIYFARVRPWPRQSSHFVEDVKTMLKYGLPLFAGTVASGLATQYATVILATVVANTVIGYYQAALNVNVPIGVISGAVASVLFRSFAELHGLEEDISLAFAYAVKYVSLISTPIVFFLLATAAPLFDLFYGPAYSPGILLLKLVAISNLPVAIGLTVLPSFFNGIGKSRFTMLISIISALSLVLGSLVLVVSLGLGAEGIIFAILVSNLAIVVPGLLLAVRFLDVHIAVKPLFGIFLAGLVAWLVVALLPLGGLLSAEELLIESLIYLLVYLTLVPVFFGINQDDLVRLSIAVDTMGPIRTIFGAFLGYERRILQLMRGGGVH